MEIIDSHCHLGNGIETKISIKDLLRSMDKAKVTKAIICPVDQFLALKNKEGNEFIINAVKKHRDRLIGFGTVNPWYLNEARKEIKRFLDAGMQGIKFHPVKQGFLLTDPVVLPLLEMINRHHLTVYVHTGTPVMAMPLQLVNLAKKFPSIKFIMGHGAYSDFWYDVIPSMKLVKNVFLETSYIDGGLIRNVVSEVGVKRLCFGSDFPYCPMEIEIEKIKVLGLKKEDESVIFHGTISKLLEVI